jgi:glutamyl-tRNA synthetase
MDARGRFAPSPTGALHLGNLRTALVSWLQARAEGGEWIVRMEDLDRVTSSAAMAAGQLADLAALGMHPDGAVVFQSQRFERYYAAIAELTAAGRTYPCFCTRREIREAAAAPHGPGAGGAYPGTCRTLDPAVRRAWERAGRRPALRLLTSDAERSTPIVVDDLVHGRYCGSVDDVVLQRNDGVPAYNLAVVVDDAAQGITHVVRGDDLLDSTPRQVLLQRLLGLPTPHYAHVPLVLAPDGTRLAKRHGAVTLAELAANGITPPAVLSRLAASLGLCSRDEPVTPELLVGRFSLAALPRTPWRLDAAEL